jgi:hypothetical protein
MYAWQQDVPIDAAVYSRIRERLGSPAPDGLIVHLALEREDGTLRYFDIWRSREDCDRFTEERLHPAVGPVLMEAGIHPDREPPRDDIHVVEVWTPTEDLWASIV